jgi:CBS domain-containing protein
MKIVEILALKRKAVVSVQPTATLVELSALLRTHRIGAAAVSSDGQRVEGIISERDVAYGLSAHKEKIATLPVSALMTRDVISCGPEDAAALVASRMQAHNIRHMPVVDHGNKLLGMVSIRDVLNLRVDELQRQSALVHAFVQGQNAAPQDRE